MRLQSYKKQVKRKRKPTKNLLIHYYFGCKDSEYFGYPLMIELKRAEIQSFMRSKDYKIFITVKKNNLKVVLFE